MDSRTPSRQFCCFFDEDGLGNAPCLRCRVSTIHSPDVGLVALATSLATNSELCCSEERLDRSSDDSVHAWRHKSREAQSNERAARQDEQPERESKRKSSMAAVDWADQNGTCTICLMSLNGDEEASLACRHRFHKACIQQWLERSLSCPHCRIAVHGVKVVIKGRPFHVVLDPADTAHTVGSAMSHEFLH